MIKVNYERGFMKNSYSKLNITYLNLIFNKLLYHHFRTKIIVFGVPSKNLNFILSSVLKNYGTHLLSFNERKFKKNYLSNPYIFNLELSEKFSKVINTPKRILI